MVNSNKDNSNKDNSNKENISEDSSIIKSISSKLSSSLKLDSDNIVALN